jgi:GDP/UDP-N,N'-diacetylbacillosamine 2-epimerase (hydrolysing)
MGEQPGTVFNVGELGVENCLRMPLMSRVEVAEAIPFDAIASDYAVVTFHPVTLETQSALTQVSELITAMDSLTGMAYIITMANADAGGRAINELWKTEGEKRKNWLVVPSLGVQRYLSALKFSKLVIGNSSSGIIEAPVLGVPTLNIGNRQRGRMMAESIVCCKPDCDSIVDGMKTALTSEFQERASRVISPFGDGTTSKKIEAEIMRFLESPRENNLKHFFDIKFQFDGGDAL